MLPGIGVQGLLRESEVPSTRGHACLCTYVYLHTGNNNIENNNKNVNNSSDNIATNNNTKYEM